MKIILYPRTLSDVEQIIFWVAEGWHNAQIFELMKNPLWRSEVTTFRGHLFCECCEQLITLNQCAECGQTLPGVQPLLFDCQMAAYHAASKNKARR